MLLSSFKLIIITIKKKLIKRKIVAGKIFICVLSFKTKKDLDLNCQKLHHALMFNFGSCLIMLKLRSSIRSIQVSPNVLRREFPVNDDAAKLKDIWKERRKKSRERKKSEDGLLGGKKTVFPSEI